MVKVISEIQLRRWKYGSVAEVLDSEDQGLIPTEAIAYTGQKARVTDKKNKKKRLPI